MRIIEWLVKNDTPYEGKLILKFEKNPLYKSIKKGFLNKIHFDLFFFKVVTRIIPKIENRLVVLNENSKVLIEKYTSCELHRKVELNDEIESGSIITHNLVYDKKYFWGDVDFAWWMFKNQIIVSKERPQFLAFKYENGKIISGYIKLKSGGLFIKIGDKIFENNYNPSAPYHEPKFWKKILKEYYKELRKADKETKGKIIKQGFKKYIPVQQHGRFQIITKEDLILSAERIFNFLKD